MRVLRLAVVAVLFSVTGLAQQPVPLINQPLVPMSVAPGAADTTLTVNGTGFAPGSVVQWNGSPLVTTFVSASQLKALIPAEDVANPGSAAITVSSGTFPVSAP